MNPKLANLLFYFFEALAIAAVVYVLYDARSVLGGIVGNQAAIDLDTGTYYFVMMLFFPLIHLFGWLSKMKLSIKHRLGPIMLGSFAFLVLSGWGGGQLLRVQLENAGYQACPRMRLHRVGAGKHLVYRTDLTQCAVPEHEPIWE